MKIKLEQYNPNWPDDYEKIKIELLDLIGFIDPKIEHIGSTSVQGLTAKPIIDILIGVNNENDLEKVIIPFTDKNFVYYQIYNEDMPYRRFFIKHKINPQDLSVPSIIKHRESIPTSTEEHHCRLAHIHVVRYNSSHWTRHVAFRDYLRTHPIIKNKYQELKKQLSRREWREGNDYNEAKNIFIKTEENNAINWYQA